MSDTTDKPRSSRGGSAALAGGLAVTALLSAPVIATTTPSAAGAVIACSAPAAAADPATAIREQFRTSFTPGAVTPVGPDVTAIICDPV
jgi:hypothetical protein